ncbi:MAG: class I SAM-dependent methyltransferase [Wenzhouxiangella sp.]|jgi:SAM-dependent methyltransferase|nr:class I SAM-dependent methyltransferase [Wenzhouxiangella sp.]
MKTSATFAADWLSLREPADHAARSGLLAEHLKKVLKDRGFLRIVDLGCGHGSNLRWLAPRLTARQRWLLVDRDPDLLEIARARSELHPPAAALEIETRRIDLADSTLDFLVDQDLVTASALFDLVSGAWLRRLAHACRAHRLGALLALSVNGRWALLDSFGSDITDDDDRFVREQFNLHQRRDKGLGAALGPTAAELLPGIFGEHGFDVQTQPSDWELPAGDALTRHLGRSLLQGWRNAAAEQAPEAQGRIEQWYNKRQRALASGELGVRVGHVDVLALPAL